MAKFIKKPTEVEAILFNGNNHKECRVFIGSNGDPDKKFPIICTSEGMREVSANDYIIKEPWGSAGYSLRLRGKETFEMTYEAIDQVEKLDIEEDEEKQIEALGYKKLDDITWNEHCKECKSHPIHGCGERAPQNSEFYDKIVWRKELKIEEHQLEKFYIEIAIDNAKEDKYLSQFIIGFVSSFLPRAKPSVKRMFWDPILKGELISVIEYAEKEIRNLMAKD